MHDHDFELVIQIMKTEVVKSVPKKEQWLYENPQALKSVLQG